MKLWLILILMWGAVAAHADDDDDALFEHPQKSHSEKSHDEDREDRSTIENAPDNLPPDNPVREEAPPETERGTARGGEREKISEDEAPPPPKRASRKNKKTSQPAKKTAATQTRAHSILRRKFFQGTIGYRIWHENVPAVSGGVPGDIPMQFHGFNLGGSYQIPLKNFRWVKYFGGDIDFGVAKGQGKGPVTDQLKDQPWFALTAKPGILYRSTAVAEFALVVPLTFRKVNWKLDDSAQLALSEKTFSAGLEGQFISRFTPYNSLLVTVTHQFMWNATVWGIAWQYDFK